jgi:hypothetical protein
MSWRLAGLGLSGLLLTAAVVAYAVAQPPAPPAPPGTPPAPPAVNPQGRIPDRGKGFIEFPAKNVVAQTAPAQPVKPADGFVNPKVEPGKVKWHATFAEACAASAKTGRPVMLFQMMGKLDDQFC